MKDYPSHLTRTFRELTKWGNSCVYRTFLVNNHYIISLLSANRKFLFDN